MHFCVRVSTVCLSMGLCVHKPVFVRLLTLVVLWGMGNTVAFRHHSVFVAILLFLITGFSVKSVWLLIFLPASVLAAQNK